MDCSHTHTFVGAGTDIQLLGCRHPDTQSVEMQSCLIIKDTGKSN